jgi:hypothetical protein
MVMRNSGIKTYFTHLKAKDVDPEAVAAYAESIDKVVPTITRKLRESQQYAADLLVSPSAASRTRGSAKPKK